MESLVLATAPVQAALMAAPVYTSWGTSRVRLRGSLHFPQYLRYTFTASADGTVAGSSEYALTLNWIAEKMDASLIQVGSGHLHIGYQYTAGDFLPLSCGVALSISAGTVTAAGQIQVTVYPAKTLGVEHEEIDLSDELFGIAGICPDFGFGSPAPADETLTRIDGGIVSVPRSLRQSLWINADALPLATRREILRWIEEGTRLGVFPAYGPQTRLLATLQDSTRPYIGPFDVSLSGRSASSGLSETRAGVWDRSPYGGAARFVNMEPLGRGIFLDRTSSSSHANRATPSSPLDASTFGWTVPSGSGHTVDFDAEIELPMTTDPGAIRWRKGTDAQAMTWALDLGTGATAAFVFSVFVRGRTDGASLSLSCSPADASIPQNSTTATLSQTWQRIFICGQTNASSQTTITLDLSLGDMAWICGAQAETILVGKYHGPSTYLPSLTTGSYAERTGGAILGWTPISVPGDRGSILFFCQPGFLGGDSNAVTGRQTLVSMGGAYGKTFGVSVVDPNGAGSEIRFRGYYDGSNYAEATIGTWSHDTVFLISFAWRSGTSGDSALITITVYSEDYPSGVAASTATGITTLLEVNDNDRFSISTTEASLATPHGAISLLRYDHAAPPALSSYWSWWTDAETRDMARYLLGREYEVHSGAQLPAAGNPAYMNLPLQLREALVDNFAAVFKGNEWRTGALL